MEYLTDKPAWFEDVFNDTVIVQWRNEITESDLVANPRLLRGTTWPWIVRELRDKAADYKDRGYVLEVADVPPFTEYLEIVQTEATARVHGEAQADTQTNVQAEVLAEIEAETEDGMFGNLDDFFSDSGEPTPANVVFNRLTAHWDMPTEDENGQPLVVRPRLAESKYRIAAVVDPRLYPLVNGRTQYLSDCNTVALDNVLASYGANASALETYQSKQERHQYLPLPCEVAFTGEDTKTTVGVQITSYINNLHPDHKDLYRAIEQVLAHTIWPWSDCLAINGWHWRAPLRIVVRSLAYENELPDWAVAFRVPSEARKKEYREAKAAIDQLPVGSRERYRKEYFLKCGFHDVIGKEHLSLPPRNSDVWQKANEYLQDYGEGDSEDGINNDDDDDMWDRLCDKTRQRIIHRHPEPGLYDDWKEAMLAHEERAIDPVQQYQEQGLQVLVAINSIALTPDEPAYAPGATTWQAIYAQKTKEAFAEAVTQNKAVCHFGKPPDSDGWSRVEDNIVATAMVAFDVTNVTTPHLAFRQSQSDITEYGYDEAYKYDWHNIPPHLVGKDNDKDALAEVLGMPVSDLWNEGCGVYGFQHIGTVAMREGRVVAFPAALGYRINPFCLVDANQPGHIRWLTLSLIDPGAHGRTVSTITVPPQQHEWWAAAVRRELTSIGGLSNETIDWILENTDEWPMGQDEAEWHRDRVPK
ncbi:hypothetical protein SEUCBS139899_004277 [Sporothrix eucalyptigena]